MSNISTFNATPLTEPVDKKVVRDFARRMRDQGWGRRFSGVTMVIGLVVMGVFAFFFISIVVGVITGMAASGMGSRGFAPFAVFMVVIMLGMVTIIVVALIRGGGTGERWYRLDRFARANGLTYLPNLPKPPLPGMIFSLGDSRMAKDLVRGSEPRFVEFANYEYSTGSGKDRTTHNWSYVAVKLDVPLPNIVLDALSNNGLFGSNLPARFGKEQRLSLEGDFDQHFSLFCPEGYETDALYLFTPDIMARFIDHAAALDVEIVDDWLFLYSQRPFATLDPATWAWLFSVVGALLDKFAQWARWRDDRLAADAAAAASASAALGAAAPTSAGVPVGAAAFAATGAGASPLPFVPPVGALRPPPGVAQQGRRLKRKVPVLGIIFVIVFGLFWMFVNFGGFSLIFGH